MEQTSALRRVAAYEWKILRGAWNGFWGQDRKHLALEAAVALAAGVAAAITPLVQLGRFDWELFWPSLANGLLVAFLLGVIIFFVRLVAEPSRMHEATAKTIRDLETPLASVTAKKTQTKIAAKPPDKDKEKQSRIYQEWKAEAEVVIPALEKYTFDILVELSQKQSSYLNSRWDSVELLLAKHYIICHHVPRKERGGQRFDLYSLQAPIRALVQREHIRRCDKLVRSLVAGERSEEYRQALQFFTRAEDDLSEWPSPLSSQMREFFWTFRNLAGEGVLDKKKRADVYERFGIKSEFGIPIQKHFLGGTSIVREFIEFDLRKVPAPDHSGGGPPVVIP